MRFPTIETPAALVDVDRMAANLVRVAAYAAEHGLAWRPHVKTHKVAALAAEQLHAGASGVTVATPGEAEVMAAVCDDIFLAYPPVGEAKLARLMRLPERVRLSVALDSPQSLRGLEEHAARAGRRVDVLVELDVGMRRVGVGEAAAATALAAEIAASSVLEYRGVAFYPGHIRTGATEQVSALRDVTIHLGIFLEALNRAGLRPRVVSGGSTPTLWRSHEIPGLTEIRPGINIFNDRTMAGLGSCAWGDCAYSVLATVVSTAVGGQVVIDAGSKSLAKEEVPGLRGYGALVDHPDLLVTSLSEEHGIIDLSVTDWLPQVGERVRVVPNHVCVSVNLQERLYGVRAGEVVAKWEVERRRTAPARAG